MQSIQFNEAIDKRTSGDKYRYFEAAFQRNIGFVSMGEQERIHQATIAIPGLGGAGGAHLTTLARLGVGRFHLADFDSFEPINVNRQYGAGANTFGRPKIDVLAEEVRNINPFVKLNLFAEGITPDNIDQFLDSVDVVVDALDFFSLEIRRLLFRRAWQKGIPVITAGPIGFGTAMIVFSPNEGMTFDQYFDLRDDMPEDEKLIAFFVGLAPKAAHKSYAIPGSISMSDRRGPSLAAGCQMGAAATAAEVVRILLNKPGLRPAPYYCQYDPFVRKFHLGRLRFGNRGPLQRLKRRLIRRQIGETSTYMKEPAPSVPEDAHWDDTAKRLPAGISDYLMQAAILAPSGDNCQPWRMAARGKAIHILLEPEADRSFFNVAQGASLISCGAATENMILAASRFGMQAKVNVATDPMGAQIKIDLAQKGVTEDPLQRFVWDRHTNRTLYDGSQLEASELEALQQAVAPFADARLMLLTDREMIENAARIVSRADLIRSGHEGLHRHLMSMIRFTPKEALAKRDGFPLKNLEAGAAGESMLRLTRPWPVMAALNRIGMNKMIAKISYQGICSSSAVGLLKVKSFLPEDLITGGRALERVWLTAARLGLSFQPMTAVTLFRLRWQLGGQNDFSPEHQRLLNDLWPDYDRLFEADDKSEGHIMLFRIGHGQPVNSRTLRKPLTAFRHALIEDAWNDKSLEQECPEPVPVSNQAA